MLHAAVTHIKNRLDDNNLSTIVLVSLGLMRDMAVEPEVCSQIDQILFTDVFENIVKCTCSPELLDTVRPAMLVYR